MHKKRGGSKANARPFVNEHASTAFFEAIANEIAMEHEDYLDGQENQLIGELLTSTIKAAIELSKLVIRNRENNGQRIRDDEIYEIYNRSFKQIISSTQTSISN